MADGVVGQLVGRVGRGGAQAGGRAADDGRGVPRVVAGEVHRGRVARVGADVDAGVVADVVVVSGVGAALVARGVGAGVVVQAEAEGAVGRGGGGADDPRVEAQHDAVAVGQ